MVLSAAKPENICERVRELEPANLNPHPGPFPPPRPTPLVSSITRPIDDGHITNAFVLRRASRSWLLFRLSVVISRFATRYGRTVAMLSPQFSRKKSNLKIRSLVRFFADKYAVTEPISMRKTKNLLIISKSYPNRYDRLVVVTDEFDFSASRYGATSFRVGVSHQMKSRIVPYLVARIVRIQSQTRNRVVLICRYNLLLHEVTPKQYENNDEVTLLY